MKNSEEIAKGKKVLTTGEVAKHCGVHFRTVIRWIDKGKLNAFKLPGRGDNRIKAEDFVVFLQDNDMPVPDEYCDLLQVESETETRAEIAGEVLQDNAKRVIVKVMILEDQQEMAKLLELIVSRAGEIETCIVLDGFQAGVMLAEFRPNIVILDLNMPGIDGISILTHLKGHEQYQRIKIAVVSGADEERLEQAKQLGADLILRKPFDAGTVLSAFKMLIEKM